MLRALLLLLVTCSALACAPSGVIVVIAEAGAPEAGPPADAAPDVVSDAAVDVAVAGAAPDAAVGDAPSAPDADAVAVADAAPDARPGVLVVRVSVFDGRPDQVQTYARCSASGWGSAAGVAATVEAGYLERGTTEPVRVFRATVSPGAVGSLATPEERVTSGVQTSMGDPYRAADRSERVDFETRGTLRASGPVTLSVTGCSVVP